MDARGDILNGAEVRGRDVFAVDVSGWRRVEKYAMRVGVRWDASLRADITAAGNHSQWGKLNQGFKE